MNCERCDRPKATVTDWREGDDHPSGCECEWCVARCWGASDCEARAVDWRAEAMKARAEVADLQAAVGAASRFPVGNAIALRRGNPSGWQILTNGEVVAFWPRLDADFVREAVAHGANPDTCALLLRVLGSTT